MAKDGRGDRRDDLLTNLRISRELEDLALVLLGEQLPVGVVLLLQVVGLDDRRKDGEAELAVERGVEVGLVDAGHLHLLAGAHHVDQVPREDHLLVAREPPRLHRAGRLLQRDLLVVGVDGLLGVERPRTLAVA